MFGFLSRKKRADEEERLLKEREIERLRENARLEAKRRDCDRKVMDAMRATTAARDSIEAAEAASIQAVRETQRSTDTAVRKVQEQHGEISGVFPPRNGRRKAVEAEAEAETEA